MALFGLLGRKPEPRVAAVQPITPGYQRAAPRLATGDQKKAANYAKKLGVIAFAAGLIADTGARCTLRVERCVSRREDAWEPDDDPIANEVLLRYRGTDKSQRELVRSHLYLNETVGEAIQYRQMCEGSLYWNLASPLVVQWHHDHIIVMLAPGGSVRDGLAVQVSRTDAARLWIQDETYPKLATSAVMRVLEDCERYWTLGRRISREADSALVGNDIIWTPSEAHTELAREQYQPGQPGQPGTDLERDYYAVAARAFTDNDSIEAVAPLLWRWAKDYGPPQKIEIGKPISKETLEARAEALECIARGLPYPQRVLVDGGADMNHWGAWLLDDQFARNGLAPAMERVCWNDLSRSFFRPALRLLRAAEYFHGDPNDWRVGFDMAPVVLHPDQAKTALELNTHGLLADAKTMEATGFDSNDLMSPENFALWALRQQMMRQRANTDQPGVGAADVVMGPPQTQPALTAAARELVSVGPMPGEQLGWLDV